MRATIRIPTEARNYDAALDEVKRHFSDVYGGYTTYECTGGWMYNGELIEEPVTVVETYGDISEEGGITQVAERVRELTSETAVMGTIDAGEKILV